MKKLLQVSWCLLAPLLAYPLGMALKQEALALWGFSAHVESWFSISFAIAQIVTLVALPSGIRPYNVVTFKRTVISAVGWTLAAHGVWLAYQFFAGTAGSIDRWTPLFTGGMQVVLTLFLLMFNPALRPIGAVLMVSLAVCAALFAVAYPPLRQPTSADLASYIPLATFLVANVIAYYVFIKGRGLNFQSPFRFAFIAVQAIIAAHIMWFLALFFFGGLSGMPRTLPLATAFVQGLVVIVIPLIVLRLLGRLSLGRFIYNAGSLGQPNTTLTSVPGSAYGKRTAWIFSYTGVSNEPRVLRQAQALLDDGWRVVVCGYDGHSPRPEQWTFVRLPTSDPYRNEFLQLLQLGRMCGSVLAVFGRPKFVSQFGAHVFQSLIPNWLHIRRSVANFARDNPGLKADLVIAHDYHTCDAAYAVARVYGAKFSVDCHEYAAEQNAYDRIWVKWHRPQIVAVQDYYLKRADVVTTVCEGISELLAADHDLPSKPFVVRSVPTKCIQPFRPVGERIKVLYHGGIWHVRQLHTAVESMRLWRPEFDLILRGEGDPSYVAELKRLANRYGLESRIFFEPPVPFADIISSANSADIGYFCYGNFSKQSKFVLPNKFFEYIAAGLALCVSDLPEMSRITSRYGCGKLVSQQTPAAIADTINSFTREEIERCKQASLRAAEDLNWDHERKVMVDAYNRLFPAAE